MARKRNNKKFSIVLLSLLVIFIMVDVGIIVYKKLNDNPSSINMNAKLHKNGKCRVFYPDTPNGLSVAREICGDKNEALYDYEVRPKGDFLEIVYKTGHNFLIDKDNNDFTLNKLLINEDSKKLISDHLRYSMKKDEIDEAYTVKFLEDTYYKNVDLSNIKYELNKDNLDIYFEKYNYTLSLPLGYVQKYLGQNLGYEDLKYTSRIHYVSNSRKMICFTFDDGPNLKESNPTSRLITQRLDELDSSSTFFLIGYSIYSNSIEYAKEMVDRGMEFGSHTQNHPYLTSLSSEEMKNEISIPFWDLNKGFGYEMKYFRPPYGEYNDEVLKATKLSAILWNVDSKDWSLRRNPDEDAAVENIIDRVVSSAKENNVVLFHDIYPTTQKSVYKLLDYYIDNGYQIVNVSELLTHLDKTDVKVFYGG